MSEDVRVWGPEIRVDGVRPEWLGDSPQPIMVHNALGWHTWRSCQVDPVLVAWSFNTDRPNVDLIRLPADHPHYATLSHATAPNGGEVGPEVVERMIAFVRGIADDGFAPHAFEATRIVALLPEPVDPDEALARRMVLDEDIERTGKQRQAIADGNAGQRKVALVLAAIKRGRALEKEAGR